MINSIEKSDQSLSERYQKILTDLGYTLQTCSLFHPMGYYHSGWIITKSGTDLRIVTDLLGSFLNTNHYDVMNTTRTIMLHDPKNPITLEYSKELASMRQFKSKNEAIYKKWFGEKSISNLSEAEYLHLRTLVLNSLTNTKS